jgi:phosphopantothenoylcysteine decarboxylase/phosphopantothenate--cysteine ligase
VTLLSGASPLKAPSKIKQIPFTSAKDLGERLAAEFKRADVLFMTAAVCDYAPMKTVKKKIKRASRLSVRLKATPDLLKRLIPYKRKGQQTVGFCLETDHLEKRAGDKLKKKKLDAIVGNLLSKDSDPFGEGKTSVLVIDRDGNKTWLEKKTKKDIARFLISRYC